MYVQKPYAFNESGDIQKILSSKMYKLFQKLVDRQPLTREEKDYVFHEIQSNSGKGNYRLLGMVIPFKQFMRLYLVKYTYENTWHEVYAFDKTCIRNSFYTNSNISGILEFNQIK